MKKEGKLIPLERAVQLKIILKNTNPDIWRRLIVESDISFFALHFAIQMTMGWENHHLFEFRIDDYSIGLPDDEFQDLNEKLIDAREMTLDEALTGKVKKFSYMYDFGDSWDHEIIVEKILPRDKDADYPVCTDGKMECPPEDCGGITGYYHLLEILKDKKHPEHKEMLEWLGRKFDPLHFDVEHTNSFLENMYELPMLQENWNEEEGLFDNEFDWDAEDEELADWFFDDLEIRIVNTSKHPLPSYETEASAGMDLRANLKKPVTLKPLERTIIKTGLFIELPEGCEAQVRPRSGLAIKHGITVLNAPGTIDADYRGEIGVILVNLSNETYTIEDGHRIAQLVIASHERAEWDEVKKLDNTSRGKGGFGSTGRD